MDRRQFALRSAAALSAGALAQANPLRAAEADADAASSTATGARPGNPIAVSTYSFWRYNDDSKLKISSCIDLAAEMGFDGVELLEVQMENRDNKTLQHLKRRAIVNGLDLCGMSTHQGFVSPDKEKRQKNIEKTEASIELAYSLGIPIIRINTGRWGTSKDFDDLMANKGIEPTLEGYTEDDAFPWVIESIEKLLPTAEKCGVMLGLENHWGLGRTAAGVMRIVKGVDSPWLKALLDTGCFLENMYEQFAVMAPETVFVQAKTYYGGGKWYTLEIDYERVGKILRNADFSGYVSLEFEGKEDFNTAIPKSLALLRKTFQHA